MTTVTEAPSVSEVEAQLREAVHHHKDLERRLRDQADSSVRQSELTSAKNKIEYLEGLLEGARKQEVRAAREERERQSRQLREEFLADVEAAVGQAIEACVEAGRILGSLFEACDHLDEIKQAYQAKYNSVWAGDNGNPAALEWKTNHAPGGRFGALDEYRTIPRVKKLSTALALAGEAIKRYPTDGETALKRQVVEGGLASDLRDLKAVAEWLKTTRQ